MTGSLIELEKDVKVEMQDWATLVAPSFGELICSQTAKLERIHGYKGHNGPEMPRTWQYSLSLRIYFINLIPAQPLLPIALAMVRALDAWRSANGVAMYASIPPAISTKHTSGSRVASSTMIGRTSVAQTCTGLEEETILL